MIRLYARVRSPLFGPDSASKTAVSATSTSALTPTPDGIDLDGRAKSRAILRRLLRASGARMDSRSGRGALVSVRRRNAADSRHLVVTWVRRGRARTVQTPSPKPPSWGGRGLRRRLSVTDGSPLPP